MPSSENSTLRRSAEASLGGNADSFPEREPVRFGGTAQEEFELDQILYCSLMAQPMTKEEIEHLAQTAASLNRMDHITGLLMYADGVFVQLIEGPRQAVNQLWARLLRDPRHKGVVQLYHRKEVESRVCEGWDMKLVTRGFVQTVIHEARTEVVNGRKTAWAPAIELMDESIFQIRYEPER